MILENVSIAPGDRVQIYGQWVTVSRVDLIDDEELITTEHPVVVPSKEYTRGFFRVDEIQDILISND